MLCELPLKQASHPLALPDSSEFRSRMSEKHCRVMPQNAESHFQEVVKIQTEFMATQMNSFNEQAKILGEVYSKAAQDAVKTPWGA